MSCDIKDSNNTDFEKVMRDILAAQTRRKRNMRTTQDALNVMFESFIRLKELGFKEAMYCPKDGTIFEAIEAGSTGIFRCHYKGEWPKGTYWCEDCGELYPSNPILFRLIA